MILASHINLHRLIQEVTYMLYDIQQAVKCRKQADGAILDLNEINHEIKSHLVYSVGCQFVNLNNLGISVSLHFFVNELSLRHMCWIPAELLPAVKSRELFHILLANLKVKQTPILLHTFWLT